MTEAPKRETVSFIAVINFVLRNVWFIVLAGLVVAALLAVRSAIAPTTYTASTSFITEGEQPPGRLLLGGITLPTTGGRGPEFYVELMRSPAILGPLVELPFAAEPGQRVQTLIERYGGSQIVTQAAKEGAIGAVASRISTRISLNGIVTLRVKAEHPILAAGIARGILEQVDDFNNTKRKLQASAERKFAEQRLLEVGAELRAAEERYKAFLERNRRVESPALILARDRIVDTLSRHRSLYSSILQAHERAKMDEVRESPRATVLASPLPPLRPDVRNTLRNAILGFFLGMILAGFAAVVREFFARIPKETSPEASEFAALRVQSTEPLRRPVHAVVSAVRRLRQSSGNLPS